MRIFNSETRKKQEFIPLKPGHVGIYACGPTVYNYFHIGNARPFILFDTLRRYFEYCGLSVTFVQNFTDIDDKMIARASEEGISVKELGERFIAEYYVDAAALNVKHANVHPKATEHIGEIIGIIKKLEKKGLAYAVNGDVYFDTQAYPAYGKLSGQNLEDLESGARVDVGDIKRHPLDFALWKAQKPGEPKWNSPWGMGRPGWHIECSAMAMKYLGETVDIHCGGQDLLFPHHENEIAQSEGATGQPFVRYWMHNGFINVDNEKMSKSLHNFFTVRDIAQFCDLESVRMFMLSAHYRSPVNFSRDMIEQAKASLERLYALRARISFAKKSAVSEPQKGDASIYAASERAKAAFIEAMDDDLNTADALGAIFEMTKAVNIAIGEGASGSALKSAHDMLAELTSVLGILVRPEVEEIPAEIVALLEKRTAARKAKHFAEADALRDEITQRGYTIEDTPQGAKVSLT